MGRSGQRALVGVFLGVLAAATCARERPLTIGIVPQMSPWTLAQRWTPVLEAWSRLAGVRLALRTAPTITAFERRVARGAYDVVYLNPADCIRNRKRYRAFARRRGQLQGILVVRRTSPVHTLTGLTGHTLAFPARHALAASIEPRHVLKDAHIAFRARYVGSHDSVYRAVAMGLFVGGGGIRRTYDLLAPALRRRCAGVCASCGPALRRSRTPSPRAAICRTPS